MKQLYILVVLLFVSACATGNPNLTSTSTKENAMPSIRYLALGDSYTIGESVDEAERWPNQLAAQLDGQGYPIDVTIIARTGWTTDELWQGIQARELNPPYDLVSLLIGVNNQYRGRDIKEYREQFIFLLNKSIEYAGGNPKRVFVLSIPDWGVTPYGRDKGSQAEHVAREIDTFNAVNREETEKAGAFYMDITPISREAVNDPLLIANDGLHPSGKMYTQWVEEALPVVLSMLK